ncbi:hypothetical protein [Pedobacter aquatilis]|uniref:hypothetical protein n=1 Tax=Pedobacter aquatilis TaxID=351343 RepID=UPI00292EA80E|nr:hypothetical protein [Pedobacter aquatilis]
MVLKKYIVVSGHPVIFPNELIHADVASEYADNVDSAGFVVLECSCKGLEVTCLGESTSLNVSSNPKIDELLILKFLS